VPGLGFFCLPGAEGACIRAEGALTPGRAPSGGKGGKRAAPATALAGVPARRWGRIEPRRRGKRGARRQGSAARAERRRRESQHERAKRAGKRPEAKGEGQGALGARPGVVEGDGGRETKNTAPKAR